MEIEGEGLWCPVRTFGSFVKTALYLSEWDFFYWTVSSMNFLSFFTIFRLWEKHCATLAQKHWKSCQMCILLEQQNFSRRVCFLKKIITFSSFDKKLCRLPPESLPPGLKNCFLLSFSGFSCITLPFPSRKFTVTNNFEGKCLEVVKKFFDMVVKTALFAFRWDFWRNFFFTANSSKFSVFFRLWGKRSGFWRN